MTTAAASDVLAYLDGQRWFAGATDGARLVDHVALDWLRAPGPEVGLRVELVTVRTAAGAETTYQLPLSYRAEPSPSLTHAYVGPVDVEGVTWHAHDAVHDHDAVALLLDGLVHAPLTLGGLDFVRYGDSGLTSGAPTVLLTGEQSNSSLVVDDHAMIKLFRRVSPGRNPDVEVLAALADDYADIVPRLWGRVSTAGTDAGDTYDLVILQAFLRTATEGWESARASVRDLLATPGVKPEDAGGDFGGEAERLGEATRTIHDGMARLLPTAAWGPTELAELAERLTAHFEESAAAVPELRPHRHRVRAAFEALRGIADPVPVQRIHGDLHLGQTLRTSIGWRLIDFEGEPARPLGERTQLDSPLRDVAGMVRSFDYAAQSVLAQVGDVEEGASAAAQWSAHTTAAFLRGYGAPATAGDELLLRAYELHKAVYETVYEAHHRPGWLHIPLRALAA